MISVRLIKEGWVEVGVEGEGVDRGVEEGVRRRSGFGNVLCVDPNDVYLHSGEQGVKLESL